MMHNEEEDEIEYEVEKIIGKKNQLMYLVKWKDYEEPTLEPENNLNCGELIEEYRKQIEKTQILGLVMDKDGPKIRIIDEIGQKRKIDLDNQEFHELIFNFFTDSIRSVYRME